MAATLESVREHARAARFSRMLAGCNALLRRHSGDTAMLLEIGALLLDFGFLERARACFEDVRHLLPDDPRPVINLANVAIDAMQHGMARELYAGALVRWPNQATLHRNFLYSQAYDPAATAELRLAAAREWGARAMVRGRGARRPVAAPLQGRPLRVGYVSADFCAHTVGFFIRAVLQRHDPACVTAFAYAHIKQDDWVTAEIRAATQFRDITQLDHAELAQQIRADGIDVLVDLSGHTAGSRLLAFAYRPAPVMVSWLGYYATTGLPCIDAVLLDDWHAPPGTEAQFVEPVVRLPGGRFCYVPAPWMPEVTPPPYAQRGHVTFGSFNNTGKLNDGVFDAWAEILRAVPDSRLVLKWRTFADAALCDRVHAAFAARGVARQRVELRGASFHDAMLQEYGDIDIALDPFPFTGGLTSCEALWMGVPLVTWPQDRVVSRQGYAFLGSIDLTELAASDAGDYVRIAVALARDPERLAALRAGLRERMRASPLCDAPGFTRRLEETLTDIYAAVAAQAEKEETMSEKILLNVGAGHRLSGAKLPPCFTAPGWRELRLDIEPANEPDILGTMLDMSAVADASVDAVYSSHNIEHLYHDEIPVALAEFRRVLKPGGFAMIVCPDLQSAAQMIAEDRLLETAYTTAAGPVTPFDIVYSHRQFTGRDKPFMAHHSGFTLRVLIGTLKSNGFPAVAGRRRPQAFDLWVVATKDAVGDEEIRRLADTCLPG